MLVFVSLDSVGLRLVLVAGTFLAEISSGIEATLLLVRPFCLFIMLGMRGKSASNLLLIVRLIGCVLVVR